AASGLVVPYSPEYRASGTDTAFLEQLAQVADGRVLTNPEEAFTPNLPPVEGRAPLAPWLLGLALLLLPLDIAARRLAFGNLDAESWLRRRRQQAVAQAAASAPVVAPLERLRLRRTVRTTGPQPAAPLMQRAEPQEANPQTDGVNKPAPQQET